MPSARSQPGYRNITIAQPTTFGLGVANRSLMDGNLLLAADVYYKLWDDSLRLARHHGEPMGFAPARNSRVIN